jgi:predicted transcriptional regulator/ribosomal protein S18 acetylase RimI-like enzyme
MEYIGELESIPSLYDDIIISILPEHSNRIYAKSKIYELRKSVPIFYPRRIFLYETHGSQRITGHIIIERIISGTPDFVWAQIGEKGTTKDRFFSYYNNCDAAYAYEISHSIQYANSLDLAEIKMYEPAFRVPQNFIYLENLPVLKKVLRRRCFEEAMNMEIDDVKLASFCESNYSDFVELVEKHIGLSYLETGKDYARKIYELHKESEDNEGVFTLNKKLLEIKVQGKLGGFIVLTEKLGGSIKTGPVIFHEEFRSLGYGKRLRQILHLVLGAAGFRKVYCTVPVNNTSAVNYLLSSSYRLEAHLSRHYHYNHDEFVFGFNLAKYRGYSQCFERQLLPISFMERVHKKDNEIVSFLKEQFSSYIFGVDIAWASRQIDSSIDFHKSGELQFKTRIVFSGAYLERNVGSIAVLKRGGSVKFILLTKTCHKKDLTAFIVFMEKELLRIDNINIRKFYSNIPLFDADVIRCFYDAGYCAEGILEAPYNQYSDMIVLAKVILDK